jgi:serine/threonine-protein kinase PknK
VTRVVLADDAVLLREALAASLQTAGFDVIGQAADVDGLLRLV